MKGHTLKTSVNKLLIALAVILAVAFITPSIADAASTPAITKKTSNILEGKKYNLNINNKIAKSTYTWTTSNKKVATVNKKGIVTGVSKGTATITCKVKAPKKTYTLTCKVTIIKPAKLIQINNKVKALNVGQSYNLNRTLVPSTSNDKTTWTTSDAKIASPDANGKFKALKQGTVTLTAKTVSGAKDTVKIKVVDKDGIVTNQSELEALLGSGASLITIKTDAEVDLTIPAGDYSKQKLVVDAPKADITNDGKFASIELKQIASDTWVERAKGNVINVTAAGARIVISSGASVSIEATTKGTVLKIENNGTVKELVIPENAQIEISGTSKEAIPITVNVPGVKIKSSVALDLQCKVKMDLTLLKGAEATAIQADSDAVIPTITGNVTIKVKVGTGDSVIFKDVPGIPIDEGTGGGGPSGPSGPSNPDNPSTSTFTFDKAITDITAVSVSYGNSTYTIGETMLDMVHEFIVEEDAALDYWKLIPNGFSYTKNGQTLKFSGSVGSLTRTVTVTDGQFEGKVYTVTANSAYSVTVTTVSGLTVTLEEATDNKSFTITTSAPITLQDALDSNPSAIDYYSKINSISVTYAGKQYTADGTMLDLALLLSIDPDTTYSNWLTISDKTKTIGDDIVHITGTNGTGTKTVTFTAGQLAGKTYTVAVSSANALSVTNATGTTLTVTKGTNNFHIALN